METYNGFTNYETWNVALWVSNDETIYNIVKIYKKWSHAKKMLHEFGITKTDDGVSFSNRKLDTKELDEVIKELS